MNHVVVVVILVQVLWDGHAVQLPLVVQRGLVVIPSSVADVLMVQGSLVEGPSQLSIRWKSRESRRCTIVMR